MVTGFFDVRTGGVGAVWGCLTRPGAYYMLTVTVTVTAIGFFGEPAAGGDGLLCARLSGWLAGGEVS